MASKGAKFSFDEAILKIRSTEPGKEAAMYGPLRDIFIHVLGYPAGDVDIDITGDAGRPDLTVNASVGLLKGDGTPKKQPWVVVEAKTEHGVFKNPDTREDIFDEKSKYIGANTAWFVMVDPSTIVARSVGGKTSDSDIVIDLGDVEDVDRSESVV